MVAARAAAFSRLTVALPVSSAGHLPLTVAVASSVPPSLPGLGTHHQVCQACWVVVFVGELWVLMRD